MLLYIIVEGKLSWKNVIDNYTTGKIPFTSYWFFIPLYLLYIFMPFLSLMVKELDKKQMLTLILLLVIFQFFLPTLYSILGLTFSLNMPIGSYFVYALIGYYIANNDIERKDKVYWGLSMLAIVSIIIRFVLVFNSTTKDSFLFSYFGFYALFPSIFVFITAKRYYSNRDEKKSIWAFLAKRSYGVYLIHTFLIALIGKMVGIEKPYFIVLSLITVYCISVIIVSVVQKCTYTKWLLP